ncbi:MAG: 2-amino-4-hydroxy-6-hydroxymethyldihydropteridine diphosphokinase [Rikenellaceae bacterium]
MISVVLLLGGNRGAVDQTFAGVVEDLRVMVGEVEQVSEILRSAAWGFQADDFLNQAVILSTALTAEQLLDATQSIERKWGRVREDEQKEKAVSGEIYASRAIDIDIIFYGQSVTSSDRLTIPHPLMCERRFVLEPLSQIAPQLCHPITGKSVEQMLNELKD